MDIGVFSARKLTLRRLPFPTISTTLPLKLDLFLRLEPTGTPCHVCRASCVICAINIHILCTGSLDYGARDMEMPLGCLARDHSFC